MWLRGETVTVRTYETTGTDPYGAPTEEPQEAQVTNVLVAPGALADLGETRPEGVAVAYTLCFPKSFAGDLEGAEVIVRGEPYHVIGVPDRYDPCPTDWNMTVEVSATHG